MGVLVGCAQGSLAAGIYGLCLVPIAVFTALFLGQRAVIVQTCGSTVVLTAAFVPSQGPGRAVYLGLATAMLLCLAPVAVLLLTRAARRHGTIDPDTGLPNGFGLAQQVGVVDQPSFLVAAIVLEGVGSAREALGYQIGTEVLRRAVEDIGQVLSPGATLGRVDGDELVVIVELESVEAGARERHTAEGSQAVGSLPSEVADIGRSLADTLVGAIGAGRYLVGDIDVPLSAHVGLSGAPWDGTEVAELVRRASLGARRAEEKGLSLVVWDGDSGTLTIDDLEMLSDLRVAAERGELSLAYQPQIAAATGSVVAVEALLRWVGVDRGAVSPGRFIPLAERIGLINELTRWVVGEALDAQVRWQRDGMDLPVSINLSAKSLPSSELAGWILEELRARHLPTSCLTVEVTETAVADAVQAAAMLAPLHQDGVRISIDDFGTGFTSLALLPTLPVDELKIDQCFVLRALESPADEAIVRTVGDLGHRLGLHVVAEGVETAAIAELMVRAGIDLLQGYHFARPMNEADLRTFVTGLRTAATGSGHDDPVTCLGSPRASGVTSVPAGPPPDFSSPRPRGWCFPFPRSHP